MFWHFNVDLNCRNMLILKVLNCFKWTQNCANVLDDNKPL